MREKSRLPFAPGGTFRRRGGYTLLEVCLVLFIIALFVAAVVPTVTSVMVEERIRDPARELENAARTARHLAMTEQRPYRILINEDGFKMEADGVQAAADALAPKNTDDEETDTDDIVHNIDFTFSSSLTVTVKPWQADKFDKPKDFLWVFQANGMSEPLVIRFESGSAWLEQTYNPLTAGVQEESYSFP